MKVKKIRVNCSINPVIHGAFVDYCARKRVSVSSQVEAIMAALVAKTLVRTKKARQCPP